MAKDIEPIDSYKASELNRDFIYTPYVELYCTPSFNFRKHLEEAKKRRCYLNKSLWEKSNRFELMDIE